MAKPPFRFTVGVEGNLAATAWTMWAQGSDVYLSQRNARGREKFSFHKSGKCHWATTEARRIEDRALRQWERDPVPARGSNRFARLMQISVPTNHLSVPAHPDDKPVTYFEPAPSGRAVMIEVLLTADPPEVLKASVQGYRLRHVVRLTNGMTAGLLTADFECGPVEMNRPGWPPLPGQAFGTMRFPDVDEANSGRPIRMLLVSDTQFPPCVWDLGGFEVTPIPEGIGYMHLGHTALKLTNVRRPFERMLLPGSVRR